MTSVRLSSIDRLTLDLAAIVRWYAGTEEEDKCFDTAVTLLRRAFKSSPHAFTAQHLFDITAAQALVAQSRADKSLLIGRLPFVQDSWYVDRRGRYRIVRMDEALNMTVMYEDGHEQQFDATMRSIRERIHLNILAESGVTRALERLARTDFEVAYSDPLRTRSARVSHCYSCLEAVDAECGTCRSCGWFICSTCEACGCSYRTG